MDLSPEIVALAKRLAGKFCSQRNMMRNLEDAQSEALVIAWRALDTYDPARGASLATYLGTLIQQRLSDYFRVQQKWRSPYRSMQVESSFQPATTSDARRIEARVHFEQLCRLAQLNSRRILLLRMAYLEGMTTEEIAPYIGTTASHAANIRAMTIQKLRRCLN